MMVYCNDSTGSRIADCTSELTFLPHSQKKANACLIAAAPEMLEALRDCMQEMPTTCHAWRQAKTIIAKATGQAA